MSTDRIEKSVFLRVPRSRVWRAIATAEEFGAALAGCDAVVFAGDECARLGQQVFAVLDRALQGELRIALSPEPQIALVGRAQRPGRA